MDRMLTQQQQYHHQPNQQQIGNFNDPAAAQQQLLMQQMSGPASAGSGAPHFQVSFPANSTQSLPQQQQFIAQFHHQQQQQQQQQLDAAYATALLQQQQNVQLIQAQPHGGDQQQQQLEQYLIHQQMIQQQIQADMRGVGAGNGARPSSGLRRRDSDQLYGVEDEAGGGDGSTDMNKRKKKKDDKVPFTAEEDQYMMQLVSIHGVKKWGLISDLMNSSNLNNDTRTPKICRERWHNHLDPSINKKQWSDFEEMQFIQAHQTLGNRWAEISKIIRGRTDNAIKNHFYSSLRKNISRISKDVITLDQKLSPQARNQSVYLISYLRNLLQKQIEAENNGGSAPNVAAPYGYEENKEMTRAGGASAGGFLMPNVGQNDKYLITKLRSYNITIEKIESYLAKLNSENSHITMGNGGQIDLSFFQQQYQNASPAEQQMYLNAINQNGLTEQHLVQLMHLNQYQQQHQGHPQFVQQQVMQNPSQQQLGDSGMFDANNSATAAAIMQHNKILNNAQQQTPQIVQQHMQIQGNQQQQASSIGQQPQVVRPSVFKPHIVSGAAGLPTKLPSINHIYQQLVGPASNNSPAGQQIGSNGRNSPALSGSGCGLSPRLANLNLRTDSPRSLPHPDSQVRMNGGVQLAGQQLHNIGSTEALPNIQTLNPQLQSILLNNIQQQQQTADQNMSEARALGQVGPALSVQNIKLNELLLSLQQVKQNQLENNGLNILPPGSQLSAISPFKRNHLMSGQDNLSFTSSISSWTDRSYNPMSPGMSDTDSVHSERRSGKPFLDRRHSLGLQRAAGPSALQVAARRIHRQNSGHAGMGFAEDSGVIDLGRNERSDGAHSHRGGSVRVQDSGFLSADETGGGSQENSQLSDGKNHPRLPAKQKSLFFRKGKDSTAAAGGASSNKGGSSTMAANNAYEKSNFASQFRPILGGAGGGNEHEHEQELVQSSGSNAQEGESEDEDNPGTYQSNIKPMGSIGGDSSSNRVNLQQHQQQHHQQQQHNSHGNISLNNQSLGSISLSSHPQPIIQQQQQQPIFTQQYHPQMGVAGPSGGGFVQQQQMILIGQQQSQMQPQNLVGGGGNSTIVIPQPQRPIPVYHQVGGGGVIMGGGLPVNQLLLQQQQVAQQQLQYHQQQQQLQQQQFPQMMMPQNPPSQQQQYY